MHLAWNGDVTTPVAHPRLALLVKDVSSYHRVHSTERIIKKAHLGLVVDCSGQIDPCLLASTESNSSLPNKCLVSTWELVYVLKGNDPPNVGGVCDGDMTNTSPDQWVYEDLGGVCSTLKRGTDTKK